MGTTCDPRVADWFLFCSFSGNYQAKVIEAIHSAPRYLGDLLIMNEYINQI